MENFQRRTTEFLDAVALFPDRARLTAPEGEWPAAFIVHHVADGELHFAARYLFTIAQENPTMIYFDEELYPQALHYEKRSIAKSLASISGIRAMAYDVLTLIDPAALTRVTTAEDGATFTLADLLEKADSHLAAHTQQLIDLAATIS